jgi:hypothetical protein
MKAYWGSGFVLQTKNRKCSTKVQKIYHSYVPSHGTGRARWATGWTTGVRFPVGAENFSIHHRVQTGSGAHPASYPMGTRGSSPGGKAAFA